jgi:hypothetical protein
LSDAEAVQQRLHQNSGGVRVPLAHDFSACPGIGYQFIDNLGASKQLAWMAKPFRREESDRLK